MARIPLAIGTQTAEVASPPVSVERLVNAYLEQAPEGRSPTPVYGAPGFGSAWASTGRVRAMLAVANRLFVVNATALCEVSSAGVVSTLGAIPSGRVDIASDGTNVVVTVRGRIYVWNGSTLSAVTDPDAPSASSVEFINGFYVFTEADSEQFFISPQANPGGDYDALDFDSADTSPDKLVRALRVGGRDLLLMGQKSVEFWYYSGDPTFPISRYQDTPLEVGLIGPRAVTTTNESAFWVGHDKTARRLDGRTATNITTPAMSRKIESWADPGQTEVFSLVWDGHLWIVFWNPDGCIVWDQGTQRWHERASLNSKTWAVSAYAYAFGKHLVGGAQVFELGGYDEAGVQMPFEMVTPWLDNGGERFSVNEVEVRLEAGTGSLVLDPKISIERTEDGEAFTAPRVRSFGRQGDRFRRVVFSRQGVSRGCAFRFRITDPVKRTIYAAYADVA